MKKISFPQTCGFAAKVVNSALKDQPESPPQRGEMFIATRSALIDAEEEKAGGVSINITCLRHVGLRRYAPTVLQQRPSGTTVSQSQIRQHRTPCRLIARLSDAV